LLQDANRFGDTYEHARSALAQRLRNRISEIELAIVARIAAAAPVDPSADPEYVHGLRAAIRAAIDYTLAVIERGERRAPPVPAALLGQARVAARSGVSLATVLRRYNLGSNQLSDFIASEAERDESLQRGSLRRLLKEQAVLLERILAELELEYNREPQDQPTSLDARRTRLIKRFLASELVDPSELDYDFDDYHVGMTTEGKSAVPRLRALARAVDGRLLIARPSSDVIWAWIGTRRPTDPVELTCGNDPLPAPLSFGESGLGPMGWRLTHEQAKAAFTYVVPARPNAIHYAEIALQAAIDRDDLARFSLRQLYISPLEQGLHGGSTLLPTLRAYLASGRNAAAAAAALGVTRQTVSSRIRSVEALLGRTLDACGADLEIALRLETVRESGLPRGWPTTDGGKPGQAEGGT
jgi:hypothetical protein